MYYQELTLLPIQEIPLIDVIGRTIEQLHIAFVEAKNNEVGSFGISFPRYVDSTEKSRGFLGDKIRVFNESSEALEKLNVKKYFSQIEDFVHITSIRQSPQTNKYLVYTRVRPNLTLGSKIRRCMKRHNVSEDEAKAFFAYKQWSQKPASARLFSATTRQKFYLFIQQKETLDVGNGCFNVYGLSSGGCVPAF